MFAIRRRFFVAVGVSGAALFDYAAAVGPDLKAVRTTLTSTVNPLTRTVRLVK